MFSLLPLSPSLPRCDNIFFFYIQNLETESRLMSP
jgi:hypothetical protein